MISRERDGRRTMEGVWGRITQRIESQAFSPFGNAHKHGRRRRYEVILTTSVHGMPAGDQTPPGSRDSFS